MNILILFFLNFHWPIFIYGFKLINNNIGYCIWVNLVDVKSAEPRSTTNAKYISMTSI